MSFVETRIDDGLIVYDTQGGPGFSTDIASKNSGGEQRNSVWDQALGRWDYGDRKINAAELTALQTFFWAMKGRAIGFRLKDWGDFEVAAAEGRLGTGAAGTGLPSYQLFKRYVSGAVYTDRKIQKPVSGQVNVLRNGAAVTIGAGAGNVAIDSVTGIVTFVADASSAANSITVGATTQVVLASNPGTLVAGKLLYLSGFAGADAALVNGLAHVINSVTGAGPFTFTLATNTAAKTITLGSGQGAKYPQAADALTWSGQFDVPVRFDADRMPRAFRVKDGASMLFDLPSLPIVELRDPT